MIFQFAAFRFHFQCWASFLCASLWLYSGLFLRFAFFKACRLRFSFILVWLSACRFFVQTFKVSYISVFGFDVFIFNFRSLVYAIDFDMRTEWQKVQALTHAALVQEFISSTLRVQTWFQIKSALTVPYYCFFQLYGREKKTPVKLWEKCLKKISKWKRKVFFFQEEPKRHELLLSTTLLIRVHIIPFERM